MTLTTIFMALAAPLFIFLGFAALCLGMEKHHREYFGRAPAAWPRLRWLRALGWLLLALSFAACVVDEGWQIGPLVWFGWLSVLGMALVFARPWLPRGQ
ncbi:MAG: DUF3325 domain-containing protein [Azoarcus sp.]|jgi:hypothetical protein|nr:DUF3325 domain-containing protein [Azoarcus sp.]